MSPTPEYLKPLEGGSFTARMARAVLPILVRQARSGKPITYGALAAELGIPFDLTTRFPLEAAGQALRALANARGTAIPPLEYLVVNAETKVPGDGLNAYHPGYSDLSRSQKRAVTTHLHADILNFEDWPGVLADLGLAPSPDTGFAEEVARARSGGGGEGPEHQALKAYVARRPQLFGLAASTVGQTELSLPSGDRPDVTFETRDAVVLVEVKAAVCSVDEVTRGIFQVVKYQAVLAASDVAEPRERKRHVVLVLGGNLPARHRALANLLGVEVLERVGAAPETGSVDMPCDKIAP